MSKKSNPPPSNQPDHDKADRDNHANQLNRNNDAYWKSRGMSKPGDDE